ncbi:MAG: META domain-containing protein, partial [Ilumatobacter sp.]|nr:META domain-containing protein [Ilumatobacter sp.]
ITNGNLDVGVMTTTEMACDAALMAQDLWLNDFLTNGPSIESDRETLTLSGGDVTISLAARQPVVLEGTTWVVTGTIVGDLVSTTPGGALASMTITDGVAAIETGCNSGSSTVEVTETTVTFDPMALTRKACLSDEAALEQSVLAVLDGEVSYELDNDMLVIRSNSTGDELGLTFVAS